MSANPPTSRSVPPGKPIMFLISLLLVPTAIGGARLTQEPGKLPIWGAWLITVVCMIFFLWAIGRRTSNRIAGVLIDNRNVMSLARLQLLSWTILIASAFLTIGLARSFNDSVNFNEALDITIPKEVWELLGISAASTVLASAVKNTKEGKDATPEATDRAAAQLHQDTVDVRMNQRGLLYGNNGPSDAAVADMFEGDELGNAMNIDLGKVQMFLFTIVAITAYAGELFQLMGGSNARMITEFPSITPALVTILALSHGTYLGTKAIDKTPKAVPAAAAGGPP
jgi:hypothetical protein